jgi:pimeloyl-ACP methyl ester carboxylesterase
MADYAADAAAVLDHVGWDSARVVGISFGGMVAQELAVTWPERIERLALLCTSPGGADLASYPLHELAELSDEARAATYLPLLDTRFTPEWLAAHDRDRSVAEMLAARRSGERPPEQARGEREQLLARSRYDGIAPPANSEAIAARVPGAELRFYEGGHAFVSQDRAALPEVMDFLAAG